MTGKRIDEIDYLKCIFILLMIAFHLVFFSEKYPLLKQWVYTFHMPAFLIISGYLMNITKRPRLFLHSMGWILVPYIIMETGYVIMSAILPVRDKIDNLTIGIVLEKLFLHPMGPYWYLHTFLLCGLCYYLVFGWKRPWRFSSRLIVLGLVYAGLSEIFHVVSLPNALYFLAGVIIRRSGIAFTDFFHPSAWTIIPLVWLSLDTNNLNRFTLGGVAIVYLIICILLWFYPMLSSGIKRMASYIGSHTLILLVFSPLFTMCSKVLVSVLSFDSSGLCFLIIAMIVTVGGSFGMAWLFDRCDISPYFFGKKHIL